MFRGHTTTGETMPNTPGSNGASDSTSLSGVLRAAPASRRRSVSRTGPSDNGRAAWTIAATRRQRRHQTTNTVAVPASQIVGTTTRARRSPLAGLATAGTASSIETGAVRNGWLRVSTTRATCGEADGSATRQGIAAPALTSTANGTRNLSDAASQSAYRIGARWRRNASVSSPRTAATIVDCQR